MTDQIPVFQIFALTLPEVRLGAFDDIFHMQDFGVLSFPRDGEEVHSREHLAALLGLESNPERSHTNLRNSLAHLIITPNQTTFDLSYNLVKFS